MDVIKLDVRSLEHPLPLERALALFATLTVDEVIHMIHRKKPMPLLELVGKEGGSYHTYEDENGVWHILISRDPMIDLTRLDV